MFISELSIHPMGFITEERTKVIFFAGNSLPDEIEGNECHVLVDRGGTGKDNHYSYIIGDNGIGKSNILKILAGVNDNYYTYFHNNYFKNDVHGELPRTIFVGPNLRVPRRILNDFQNLKIIDSNKYEVSRSLLHQLQLFGWKGVCEILSSLSINVDRIEITPRYDVNKLNGNVQYYFHTRYKYTLFDFQQGMFSSNLWDNSDVLDELRKINGGDDNELFAYIRNTKLFKILTSSFAQLSNKNNTRGTYYTFFDDKNFVDICNNCRITLTPDEQVWDDRDLLILLLFDEMEWINVDVQIKPNGNNQTAFPLRSLSSGELLRLKFASYFTELRKNERKNILFLYDEPEISLHPSWQKEVPQMIKSLAKKYGIVSSHFIFATHSPLVVMQATGKNDSVIKLSKENGALRAEIIDDVHHYSIENTLNDLFSFSYYSNKEKNEIDSVLKNRYIDFEQYINEANRLDLVKRSLKLFDEISNNLN